MQKIFVFLIKIKEKIKESFREFPARSQWKLFFKVLNKKEKIIFFSCFVCFVFSFVFLASTIYCQKTKVMPKPGGIYIEGVVGQPRFINPVLSSSDVDRDLTEILFSGLMKYDKNGDIIPDLAEKCDILEQGKIYEITLKQNIFWHDAKEITSDDIVFTIQSIQDQELKSPEMTNWAGVEVEKLSKNKVLFKLDQPYFPFLERLTIKILPKHIFENIVPENFALTIYNLEPIGSGPFKFKQISYDKLGKIQSLTLIKNKKYYGQPPYLDEIKFLFFENEGELIDSFKKGQIQGIITSNSGLIKSLKTNRTILYNISLPRYFALFFNPEKSDILESQKIRQALNLAVDKKQILENIFENQGKIVNSPILPEVYGFNEPETISEFDLVKAKELLEQAGLKIKDGKLVEIEKQTVFEFTKRLEKDSQGKEVENLQQCLGFFPDIYPEKEITGYFGEKTEKAVIAFQEKYKEDILEPWGFDKGTGIVSQTTRKKLNEVCNEVSSKTSPITFSLYTVNQEFLIKTAELLKQQWEKLGLQIEIKTLEFNELSREIIKPREYEMLLFGEVLAIIPDPLAFWHSSRMNDPGLNLAMYENKKADELLKKARQAQSFEELKQNLEEFQNILLEDSPAVFLYNPDFLYLVSNNIKGIDLNLIAGPSKRFLDINNWYIKTKRIWK